MPLPLKLPPTSIDIAISRTIERHSRRMETGLCKVLTWAADEKPLLAAALLYWVYSRNTWSVPRTRSRADHLVICTAASAALPHLFKRLIDRRRPDRELVHGLRHGLPRSGNPDDSFPSGHAMHLGSIAAAITRTSPARTVPIAWGAALGLASTRLLLLAHYPSDVASGLLLGRGLEWLIARLCRRQETAKPVGP